MKAKMLGVLAVLICFAMMGCATSPASQSSAHLVPASRLFAYQEHYDEGKATAIVLRDNGFEGRGCGVDFYVDGKVAASFAAGEMARFTIKPGEHILGVSMSGKGLCGGKRSSRREVTETFSDEQTKVFRIAMSGNGELSLGPTSL